MLDTGQVISAKMKTLAAGTTKAYNAKTTDIKAIRMADSLPSGFVASDANTISTSTSRHPVYIFYDNADNAGIMYVYSGGYEIVMNPDSSHAFRSNLALADISGLKDWNTSKVTNMYLLLLDSTIGLNDLDPLIDWDTSSVENMRAMFKTNPTTLTAGYISSLTDISGLINWNVSNVTSMQEMFPVTPLSSLHGLENWDVSKVENMHMMFGCTDDYIDTSHLTDISALANWNTSSVTDMGAMFQNRKALTDLSALANWDTSKVTDTSYMFHGAGITSVETLTTGKNNNPKIWNTGNVTTMKQMFAWTPLTSLHGLENWDTSKLENVCGLVFSASRLTDVSALTNWDTARVSDMSATFKNTTSLQTIDPSGWSAASVTSMQEMFMNTTSLNTVYVSQAGLDSFNTAINNGATITDMWRDSGVSSFTVKP